jgi:hypothetical protein
VKRWIGVAAALVACSAFAQAPSQALDPSSRSRTVAQAAEALRTQYIYPDVGRRAAAAIESHLISHAYDGLTSHEQFGQALTLDLAAVTHDKHLRVLALNAPPPPDLAPAPSNQGGIVRADRLAADVGYLEVVDFPPIAEFTPALDRAMGALATTKALIIDLRRNGGGSPGSVDYLVSYFTPASKPLHLNDIIWRNPSTETFRAQQFFTVATPAKYLGRPVYVLTSHHTFSAGEECAYDLQTQKLAKIVGEVTGGGANPGAMVRLGSEFLMIMPIGRALNPVTNTNWERRGVSPDVRVPSLDALKVALRRLGVSVEAGDIEHLSREQLFTIAPPAPRSPRPGSR